jgi:hypothetical protein
MCILVDIHSGDNGESGGGTPPLYEFESSTSSAELLVGDGEPSGDKEP